MTDDNPKKAPVPGLPGIFRQVAPKNTDYYRKRPTEFASDFPEAAAVTPACLERAKKALSSAKAKAALKRAEANAAKPKALRGRPKKGTRK